MVLRKEETALSRDHGYLGEVAFLEWNPDFDFRGNEGDWIELTRYGLQEEIGKKSDLELGTGALPGCAVECVECHLFFPIGSLTCFFLILRSCLSPLLPFYFSLRVLGFLDVLLYPKPGVIGSCFRWLSQEEKKPI